MTKKADMAGVVKKAVGGVSRETIVTAVINQKGGVGKTTTAISLAHGLALQGKKVLLADLDAQANATLSLGASDAEDGPASVDLLRPGAHVDGPFVPRYENLHILPGTPELVQAEFDLIALTSGRERVLQNNLRRINDSYDFIVIDAPPSLGLTTLNILAASDNIIVPVQAEFLALEGVNNLRRTVELVAQGVNPGIDVLGFLLTMVDTRTNLSNSVIAGLRESLGDLVFNAMIPRTVRLSECPSLRCSIFEYDRWGAGARAYESFVFEYLGRVAASRRKVAR